MPFQKLGFDEVLASPTVVTHISYALHVSSPKVHTLASELLAAITMLSIVDGHKAVLAALSDFRVAFDEDFRFKNLLSILRTADIDIEDDENSIIGFGDEEEGVWEARIGVMALLNALTNCPEDLEERILLREELSRRGLNELIVVCSSDRSQIHSLIVLCRHCDTSNLQICCSRN